MWKNRYTRAGHRWKYSAAHALCMPYTWDYRHTLRICNYYYFSMATMVTRKRPNLTLYVHARLIIIQDYLGKLRESLHSTRFALWIRTQKLRPSAKTEIHRMHMYHSSATAQKSQDHVTHCSLFTIYINTTQSVNTFKSNIGNPKGY